jgi:hypothetical protein
MVRGTPTYHEAQTVKNGIKDASLRTNILVKPILGKAKYVVCITLDSKVQEVNNSLDH